LLHHQLAKTLELHTLDHITKESEVHRKREKVHTHYPSLTFSLLSGPVAEAAEKKPSRKRQHDFLQTTHCTAWGLLRSSTFIHYRPLYLHVASHWFNLNVSAWRQISPPFGFQCLKDCVKEGRCGQGSLWLSLVQWSSLVSWSNLRDLESPLSPPLPLPYLEHIHDTTRYQGYFFAEPKMGWRRYFKIFFRVSFCFMYIRLVETEPPRKNLPKVQTCGIESSLNAVTNWTYKVMVMNLMT